VDCFSLVPNPTADVFEIEGLLSNYTIDILDAAGMVYQTVTNTGSRVEIDINDLPSGLYFIRIVNNANNTMSMEKILKLN